MSVAFLAFIWSFTIQEPDSAPRSQTTLEPLLPILKRPHILAFFAIEFILLFSHAPFYSFYSNYLKEADFTTTEIGFLWAVGVIAEIIMFAYAHLFLSRYSLKKLVSLCLIMTSIRWMVAGLFSNSFIAQFAAQTIHAFSFGLFHLIAMRMIFQNFSAGQQGRGQALYSTMWGLGVAFGSILAGHFWKIYGGSIIFITASGIVLLGLLWVKWLPSQFEQPISMRN